MKKLYLSHSAKLHYGNITITYYSDEIGINSFIKALEFCNVSVSTLANDILIFEDVCKHNGVIMRGDEIIWQAT